MHSKLLKDDLMHYIDAGFPIIYLNTFEEMKADEIIAEVANANCLDILEWNGSIGHVKWNIQERNLIKLQGMGENSVEETLDLLKANGELKRKILVLKDINNYHETPRIISILKDISHQILRGLEATIIIVSPVLEIPKELEKYTTIFEIGYLDEEEIRTTMIEFISENDLPSMNNLLFEEMVIAFKGLSEYEIKSIMALAFSSNGEFNREDLKFVFEQKKQTIKKSGILEMIEVSESIDNIGGLENLKKWFQKKAKVYKNINSAIKFGVDMPKGVLIAGVPGCGKSISAKSAAKLFEVPLLRLDMGRLLGKYVGESEANMRKAIKLAEAISPCVLWIDEIEKAFAGIGADDNAAVTTRLFGNFLTWMQEKNSPTFVVATANDIIKLPPELMRKGRFDEIFYVGLPSDAERKKIFEIHISKRRKEDLPQINIDELVKNTKGYSGADIEGVVKDSIEAVFADDKSELTTNDILEAIKNTHSLSEIMKEPIEKMSKEYETRKFKNASTITNTHILV